ncbi:uncharacterized protein BDZ99DRAFT_107682 [Mytilinidion resinicola]|uniref:Uncharacterized protein n=1 Tax=Mytilinidion resinicola TaxID=574789 RepID=A0A6A6YCM4_9PEZI|nr:uncharacterized protein BDZ99DRAFT_107682 [Mytilinidion resinicola]KAF2805587.1 hypothetical protein BDZ99DRAFT_107682 [Mytilinidion resinicola]
MSYGLRSSSCANQCSRSDVVPNRYHLIAAIFFIQGCNYILSARLKGRRSDDNSEVVVNSFM